MAVGVVVIAAGSAAAQISSIAAANAAHQSAAAARAPQSPGIARISGSYDTAGVLDLDVAFRHPLTALRAGRQYAWTITVTLGTAVSATDPAAGCRASLRVDAGIGDRLASVVTPLGGPTIPVAASVTAAGAAITLGSPAIAGRDIACLTAVMIGRVRAPAGAPGARLDPGCGCAYTTTVADRLRAASGDPVAWFAGLRPAPRGPSVAGPTARAAWIATVVVPTTALREPGTSARVAHVSTASTVDGGPQGLLVLAARRDAAGAMWIDVRLPTRPNTAQGWIPADDVTLAATPWRIVVSLRARALTILDAGHRVARIPVVIGKPSTPTPRGLFAVAAVVRQTDPSGFLGPYALHLTAHSNVLDNYGGGPGRIAIHGRGAASLLDPLGSARSHGCIRINNNWVVFLATHVPRGTPVLVD